jgi:hypothetical protein
LGNTHIGRQEKIENLLLHASIIRLEKSSCCSSSFSFSRIFR